MEFKFASPKEHHTNGDCKSLQCKKAEFQRDGRDASELLLFHGTSPSSTNAICAGNFDLNLSNRFVFGRGIYFSRHVSFGAPC